MRFTLARLMAQPQLHPVQIFTGERVITMNSNLHV